MARIKYANKVMSPDRMAVVAQAESICQEYAAQGLSLTLRQAYYQFVARDLIANRQSEYKRLGEILNDARMGGHLDWDYLVDRTRNLADWPHWRNPSDMASVAARQYATDLWAPQHRRIEVWIEKDAAIGVVEGVCQRNQVPYFSCRGYASASELWAAGQRIGNHLRHGDAVTVLHVGDHDPSGLDMTRDISDRLRTFIARDWVREFGSSMPAGPLSRGQIRDHMRQGMRLVGGTIGDWDAPWRVRRIALTLDQIRQYDPPPNPAKTTDARFERYRAETGLDESWELDALDPTVMNDLIQSEIDALRDEDVWASAISRQEHERALLTSVSDNWSRVSAFLTETES